MVAENDPIEAALAEVKAAKLEEKAVAHAVKMSEALKALDSQIAALQSRGVAVSVSLAAPVERPWDKIEQPGSTKAPGWYAYVDFMDEEGTKKRIDAAKKAAGYAVGSV